MRSRSGGAILANDPHLGIFLPNAWLIVGLKSPSYHAVGLMAPGLPIFAIGRVPGWAVQVMEQLESNILIRPLTLYNGPEERPYVPIEDR